MKKSIDSGGVSCYTINCSGGERDTKYGGIAQLGERLNGIQEVSGSIPLISTISHKLSGRQGPVAKTKNTKLQKNRLGSPKRVAQSAFLR